MSAWFRDSLTLFLLFFCSTLHAQQQALRIVTEPLPPLQIQQPNGKASGATIEIMQAVLKQADLFATIEFMPWARSYKLAKQRPNTLIFSIARTQERENDFLWVEPIYQLHAMLIGLKQSPIANIENITQAQQYKVGVVRHDFGEDYLIKRGFINNKNLYLSPSYKELWPALFKRRTDLALTNNILFRHEIPELKYDVSQVEVKYIIPDAQVNLYIAAHLQTDSAIIKAISKAFTEIKNNGTYQKILTKWQI
jgi:polar amino acid transport system substrate-binding protein